MRSEGRRPSQRPLTAARLRLSASQDEECLAFADVNPQAPFHALVIPKSPHLPMIQDAQRGRDEALLGKLMVTATEVAASAGLKPDGYRLVINNGRHGAQSVYHLHIHIMGGRQMRTRTPMAATSQLRPLLGSRVVFCACRVAAQSGLRDEQLCSTHRRAGVQGRCAAVLTASLIMKSPISLTTACQCDARVHSHVEESEGWEAQAEPEVRGRARPHARDRACSVC